MIFDINEKFITLSGEAPIPGSPIYLIRFTGCNLKCAYCDTPFNEQVNYEIEENELFNDIIMQVDKYPFLNVLFTGGEPLMEHRQKDLARLIIKLEGKTNIYVETNGSVNVNFFPGNTHFVCDWKTPSSGYEKSFKVQNLKSLRPQNDCIKFVVNKGDLDWVKEKLDIIKKENPGLPVYLSPQWGSSIRMKPRKESYQQAENIPGQRREQFKDIAEYILKNRLPVIMSLQLHKIIWGNDKEGILNDTIL